MKILIEAHHPAHIHFWKYPIQKLQALGHEVRMLARDRDVMRQLLDHYDWIDAVIPDRINNRNRFPVLEMLQRQWVVARTIARFKPDVVTSLMGSYTQSARLFGIRNIIFTDTETQEFNHKIAHPFADEIHTPDCFYKALGRKQHKYPGLHELAFLDEKYFTPDREVLEQYGNLEPGKYIIIRMSAWNTLHDMGRSGIGEEVYRFVDTFKERYRFVLSAEENKVPPGLEKYCIKFHPKDFHSLIYYSEFVLTEGASTTSEAACMGVPSVFINSVGRLGNFDLLDKDHELLRAFSDPQAGVSHSIDWLNALSGDARKEFQKRHSNFLNQQTDVCDYVVGTLLREKK